MDAQGLLGADGRYYVLDVFRTMPADANYQHDEKQEEEEGKQEEEKKEGEGSAAGKAEVGEGEAAAVTSDPKETRDFPHGLCRLRPELVKAYLHHK